VLAIITQQILGQFWQGTIERYICVGLYTWVGTVFKLALKN